MVDLDVEKKIIQYIQSDDFKLKIVSSLKYSVEYVELLDIYGSSQLYIISTLVHLKNHEGLVITNYSKFVLLVDEVCTLYEGHLAINEEPIDIEEFVAKVFFVDDVIKVQYKGIFCCKKKVNNFVFRLNSGFEIKEVSASTNIVKFEECDYLRNGYVMIFKDHRYNHFTIQCNYEGIPRLGFDNILSQKRSCLWGESFIFPYMNYVPILKSKYCLTIWHPIGTVLVGGKEINRTDGGIVSQLQSGVASPLPLILWGQYIYKTISVKKSRYTVYIYHNKEYDSNLEACVVDIIKKYEHYYGKVPYTDISIVFDKYSRVSCTQGNIIIMRNDDVAELAHELAHLWWGSCVSFYGQGAKWLQEGMADISSNWYLDNDVEKLLTRMESGYGIRLEELLYNTAFGNDDRFFLEGMKYLLILINRISKDKFIKEIQYFINKNKYKNVQSIEFLKLFDISEYSTLYKILGEGEIEIE